ncbi:MAG: hypothetical protein F4230_15080 [Holophagales bacterium]|nr:hypothetical protein [Holophagales bacterium]MYF06209.1 hypothetical protein [Holophagales bacterium]MYJ25316.1 hypothetical protein [Holophagales bacterium]
MARRFALALLILMLAGCGGREAADSGDDKLAEGAVAEAADSAPTHLGGCILLDPKGDVPEDVYQHGDVVATNALAPFTKELQVYGLKLAARDDISDDYMRLVARTIAESFPRDAGLDADFQRELLANHYRYNALIPVPLGYDYSFMDEADERWAAIERDNSVCDVIMQDVPQGQVMEVVEHILHYVTDIGLHYTFPEVWGIAEDSELARAMAKAVDEGYYQADQYLDIEDAEIRFRVQMQEFAYWFITTAWNLQAPYGPVWEEEWTIRDQDELREKLPELYAAYEETAARVMVAPSLATLREIGPTRAEERGN